MSDYIQRSRIENLQSTEVDRQSPTGLIFFIVQITVDDAQSSNRFKALKVPVSLKSNPCQTAAELFGTCIVSTIGIRTRCHTHSSVLRTAWLADAIVICSSAMRVAYEMLTDLAACRIISMQELTCCAHTYRHDSCWICGVIDVALSSLVGVRPLNE